MWIPCRGVTGSGGRVGGDAGDTATAVLAGAVAEGESVAVSALGDAGAKAG